MTAIGSVINAVFLRPLPFPEADRIVNVVRYGPSGPVAVQPQAAVALLRDRSRAFSILAGVGVSPGVNLVSDHGTTFVRKSRGDRGLLPRSRDRATAGARLLARRRGRTGDGGAQPRRLGRPLRRRPRRPRGGGASRRRSAHGHRDHAARLPVVPGSRRVDAPSAPTRALSIRTTSSSDGSRRTGRRPRPMRKSRPSLPTS